MAFTNQREKYSNIENIKIKLSMGLDKKKKI